MARLSDWAGLNSALVVLANRQLAIRRGGAKCLAPFFSPFGELTFPDYRAYDKVVGGCLTYA
jgi:hypothetical protein